MKFYIVDDCKDIIDKNESWTDDFSKAKQFTFAEAKRLSIANTNYDGNSDFWAMIPVLKDDEVKTEPKPEQLYYIWCVERQRYWRPNSDGYCNLVHNAGKYTLEEATKKCLDANINGHHEMMIPIKQRVPVGEGK